MKNSLLGNRDFLKLWIGQSISQAGVQISLLALPLVAAQSLQATSFQMGALRLDVDGTIWPSIQWLTRRSDWCCDASCRSAAMVMFLPP